MQTIDRPVSATTRPHGAPWSLRDAAEFIGVSPRHLARLLNTGAIKSFKIGRRVLLADVELRRIAAHGTEGERGDPLTKSQDPLLMILVVHLPAPRRLTARIVRDFLAALLALLFSRLILGK